MAKERIEDAAEAVETGRLVDLAGRQRMLNQRAQRECLQRTLGIAAAPEKTLLLIRDTAHLLAEGGISGGKRFPPAPTDELVALLQTQLELCARQMACQEKLAAGEDDSRRRECIAELLATGASLHEVADQTVQGFARWSDEQKQLLAERERAATVRNEEIRRALSEQAQSLAATSEELTSTVRQSSEGSQQAVSLARGAQELAGKGRSAADAAVLAFERVAESVASVSEFVDTMQEIAFQTNLLALNSAVEAARAGAAGAGFAVVAREVRNLAQRAASAAREVRSVIVTSEERLGTGKTVITGSSSTLVAITDAVGRLGGVMEEMVGSGREQGAGIEALNRSIEQLLATAEDGSEVRAPARVQRKVAGKLRRP